jgi:hypothetical protein
MNKIVERDAGLQPFMVKLRKVETLRNNVYYYLQHVTENKNIT